uniref:Transmembrane protein 130 n=1 Tax=Hucho hucho TaxID=62062 RepID=A0A4W5LXG7_9TELE
MYRNIIVLVFVSFALILATDGLIHLKNVSGKLSFIQREGNATYVRDRELASEVPTETKFELFDPRNTLRTAKFNYTWDFGNGEVLEGSEPYVHHNYLSSGNYTLRLRVGAQVNKSSTPLTGVYTMDITVLDPIRNIELKGPLSFQVSRNNSLAIHVDGSPPMWVCWRFLQNCVSATPTGCHLTMLYDNTFRLNHTFTALGVHCLDISARNDISKLQTSNSIFVRRDPSNNLLFILPCAGIILAILSFITVIASRPKKGKNKPQVSEYSNATYYSIKMELQPHQDIPDISSDLYVSRAEKGEVQTLLLQHGTRADSYSYRN